MSANSPIQPCCLTIAGSDSGGNAGVQADLRAFHAYGLHGCTVFAALTAQTPFAVQAAHSVPADFIAAQLEAVLGAYAIAALKTGMLADPAAIEVVAAHLKSISRVAKVIDPVMIATSGARLIAQNAIEVLKKSLIPQATLLTPNLPEAECLLGQEPSSPREATAAYAEELARGLYATYGVATLVKGGHGADSAAVDILFDGTDAQAFAAPRIAAPISTHGTGCSLAAALAAELALGHDLPTAVKGAKDYVYKAIEGAFYVGKDCGVLGFVDRREER